MGRKVWQLDVAALLALLGMMVGVMLECARRGSTSATLSLGVAALVLFIWLGSPWQFESSICRGRLPALAVAAIGILLGLVLDMLLPLAIGWSALLWFWLDCRLKENAKPAAFRLMLLTCLVFPWIDLDLKAVGWAMRVTSTIVTQHVLSWSGFEVVRMGTMMTVNGQLIEVGERCAGGDTLHAMLLIGVASAYVFLRPNQRIVPWLPVVCGLAWLANALRLILISVIVGLVPPRFYATWMHDGGGLVVVSLMLVLCMAVMAAASRRQASVSRDTNAEPRTIPAAKVPARPALRKKERLAHLSIWGLLVSCIVIGYLWKTFPLPGAGARLDRMPSAASGAMCRDVPFSEAERSRIGDARAIKRAYRCDGREFLVTVIDGTQNRRAVHDPTYCWTIISSAEQPLTGGRGIVVRVADQGNEKEILFWFSDGSVKYAEPVRYLLQTGLRRATLGWSGEEPVLVLVEPLDLRQVNWFQVLDHMPWLMEL
jgi:exosortase/archaeosortase family protein